VTFCSSLGSRAVDRSEEALPEKLCSNGLGSRSKVVLLESCLDNLDSEEGGGSDKARNRPGAFCVAVSHGVFLREGMLTGCVICFVR
jgi:hypothetical protein